MLDIRTAYTKVLKATLTEMVYGKQIRLPVEFFNSSTETKTTDFVKDLQQWMRNLKPTPATRHGNTKTFVSKELESTPYDATHIRRTLPGY